MLKRSSKNSRIAIVGLGSTGQSMGLAIKANNPDLTITGHDKDPDAARTAQRNGAVDDTHWNLVAATEKAVMVVLALPAGETLETALALAGNLAPGTVLTSTNSLQAPMVRWSQERAATDIRYVPGNPLAKPSQPSAEAFKDSIYCLMPTPDTDTEALDMVVGLVEALGAKPVFLSPEENDSLMLGLQILPALTSSALVATLRSSTALADIHRLRDAIPSEIDSLAARTRSTLHAELKSEEIAILLNWLERYLAVLRDWQQRLASGGDDAAVLLEELREIDTAALRRQAEVDNPDLNPVTGKPGSYLRRMLGMR